MKQWGDGEKDWHNDKEASFLYLNPRTSLAEKKELHRLVEAATILHPSLEKAHIWLASSGSSKGINDSSKIIALSKKAFRVSAKSVNAHLEASSSDKWIKVLPSFHVGGLSINCRAALSSSRVISVKERWNAKDFTSVIKQNSITLAALVPTQLYDLVELSMKPPSSLRALVIGGASLSEVLYHKAKKLGWPILPSYGMTETCSQIATADLKSLENFDYPQLKILTHMKIRKTSLGLIELQSKSLFSAFAQKKNNNYVIQKNNFDWFATEDYCRKITSNYVEIQGRESEYIKISGEGVDFSKLKSIFENITGQNPSFVLAHFPNPRTGNEIGLIIESKDFSSQKKINLNSSQKKMISNYNKKVFPYEKIRKVLFLNSIPKTELGKINWSKLINSNAGMK